MEEYLQQFDYEKFYDLSQEKSSGPNSPEISTTAATTTGYDFPLNSSLFSPVQEGTVFFYCEAMKMSVGQKMVKKDIVESSDLDCPNLFIFDSKISKISVDAVVTTWPGGIVKQQKFILDPIKLQKPPQEAPPPPLRKLLVWNRRGVAERRFTAAIRELVKSHRPSVALIFNTSEEEEELIRDLGFSRSYRVEPSGFLGGLWLLWRDEDASVRVSLLSNSLRILAEVHFLDESCGRSCSYRVCDHMSLEYMFGVMPL